MQRSISQRADAEFHSWTWVADENAPSARLRHISGYNVIADPAKATWNEIYEWLGSRKPSQAIVTRTVKLIRLTADARETRGTVGRQCMSVVIFSDPTAEPVSQYHTSVVTATSYMPGHIEARGGTYGVLAMADPSFGAVDKKTPFQVPQVPRNRPCPCGSGRKYKYCHGRTFKIRPGSS